MNRFLAWILVMAGGVIVVFPFTGLWQDTKQWIPSVITGQSAMSDLAFSSWLKKHVNALDWGETESENRLNQEVLEASLELGHQFIVNNQKPEGNFNYEYDFVKGIMAEGDSQVRQAGALWGLALIHQYHQTHAVQNALEKGLQFFFRHTRQGPSAGTLLIAYPGDPDCKTGTVALVALAITEYLRSEENGGTIFSKAARDELVDHLEGYLKFLEHMHLDNGRFSQSISIHSGDRSRQSNPYFDGESLLSLIKAAKYLGFSNLIPLIENTAIELAKRYTIDAWQVDADSSETKGFYQWGSMAFWEYQDAGWKHGKTLGDCVLALAWWMIHTHRTLERTRNTAYAYEGIIHAYRLARARKINTATRDLAHTIDTGLHKLTSWQVGGPLVAFNPFLLFNWTKDPLAVGGVMNHRAEAPLRIDVTQHQMHAVILALQYVYTKGPPS